MTNFNKENKDIVYVEGWEDFYSKNKGDENLIEIFDEIETAKKRRDADSLRKVLNLVKKLENKEYDDEIKTFFNWMRNFQDQNNLKLNWWEEFSLEKEENSDISFVFKAIDSADLADTEEALAKAVAAIDSLDEDKYKYDILTFRKRTDILEKRLERKVSANLGRALSSLRMERGLSMAQVAQLTGVSSSYISRIESGSRRAPTYPIMEKLASALSIDVSTLLAAAGFRINEEKDKSIRELLFSNNVFVFSKDEVLSVDKKQELMDIINFIESAEWKSSKHIEMLSLLELVDKYKDELGS